ncbi:hypothetical protein [Halobacillus halophilus]|uniref:hypothetical protein n=1 Tax=Halobacillus halophilus TaxID=1570 RepID=UPI001CD491E3|nr:hypothetical protein [Halobacillus halophilus]MCA1011404.1 hypothetical protein [Halobacillus halophilus]
MRGIKKYFKFVVWFSILFLAIGCSNSSSGSSSSGAENNSTSEATAEETKEKDDETKEKDDESESKQNIQAALESMFNGPNEKLEKALDGMKNKDFGSEDYQKHLSDSAEYFEQHYKPYVSDSFYEASFIDSPDASYYLKAAYPEIQLKTEGITIEDKEDYYKFSIDVSYTTNKSGEGKTVEIRGHAQTNEEGKVSSFNFINPNELYLELS